MRIALYLLDKIVEFILPKQVSGSFSFGIDENEESKLINIEARDGKWVMYQTSDVSILNGQDTINSVILTDHSFYVLQKEQKSYLIFVTDIIIPGFALYTYTTKSHLSIGNTDASNIKYIIPYLNGLTINVAYKENKLLLEKHGNSIIYVNKMAMKQENYEIHVGDELEVFGLRFIFLKEVLLVSQMYQRLIINAENANLIPYQFIEQEPNIDIEIKDVDLYNKEEYFSKSPRLRRLIEPKTIKLSQPPKEGESNEVPVMLVIGPMLTMGVTSGTMMLNTVSKIYSGEATMSDSWPQIISGGAMLVSMLVWPLVTQWYNRHMKKKKTKEITAKYNKYLEEKKEELEQESKLQREILYENLITVSDCLNIIKNKSINFWDKRIDQKDFLLVRIGLGNEKLDVNIEYPEEGFTIEESELKKQADILVSKFKYIENVPVGYSFYDNKTTAIMGSLGKVTNFMHNILLQLMTFYSYEDVKIVMFTSEERRNVWDYLRYLNHSFNNEKSFRFFATDQESTKNVAEYLQLQINH